jgi:nitroreductase
MDYSDNPVLRAILSRRSIRHYTGEAVSREAALGVLEAGRWAPSGKNSQPWRFLALFQGDPRQEALAGCTKYARLVREAGLLIVVLLHRESLYHEMKDHQAAGACMQNMLLAAHAIGLGGVWLGEIVNQADQVLAALGLSPETYEFQAVLALGHPARTGSSERLELAQLLVEAI